MWSLLQGKDRAPVFSVVQSLAGAWGTGNGTTSYSENVGALGITKVRLQTVVHGYVCGRGG